jgi:hypothetical protein
MPCRGQTRGKLPHSRSRHNPLDRNAVSADPAPKPAAVRPAARPRRSGNHFSACPMHVPYIAPAPIPPTAAAKIGTRQRRPTPVRAGSCKPPSVSGQRSLPAHNRDSAYCNFRSRIPRRSSLPPSMRRASNSDQSNRRHPPHRSATILDREVRILTPNRNTTNVAVW